MQHRVRPLRMASRVLSGAPDVGSPALVPLFYNDHYEVPLPPNHRFPMAKYRMVREQLQAEAAQGTLAARFEPSPLASEEDLITCHCPEYVSRYLRNQFTERENRRVGFPWSEASVRRSLSSTGGTIAATRAVLTQPDVRFAGHIAGGTHHAFADRGEGFCVFNDIAVAASAALRDFHSLQRILIIDLDVHQGNGSAALFDADPRVFTFSMHCVGNYFSKKEFSDCDVEVPVGAGDEAYLAELRQQLPRLFHQHRPQLTFFQAGVDPHISDAFGKLALTHAGLKERNRLTYEAALAHGSRLVVTMGGGYPRDLSVNSRAFADVVAAHVDVYRGCAAVHKQSLTRSVGRSTGM